MELQNTSVGRREGNYSKAFQCYRDLQSESYEFISRIIAAHNWLEEAHRILTEKPELDAGQLDARWRPIYAQVYRQAFAPFLAANRILMFPYNDLLGTRLESFMPGEIADSFAGIFGFWGEQYAKLLSGIAETLNSNGNNTGQPESQDKNTPGGADEPGPAGVPGKIAGDETSHYFEAIAQFLGCLGENQYFLPKEYVVNLQKVVATYPRVYQRAQRYEAMFRDTWESAMKEFAEQVKETSFLPAFSTFFDSYRGLLAARFEKLLKSPGFIKAQADFLETSSDLITATRKMMESQLAMFPFLPFVTSAETEAIAKNVHSYKKRMDKIERNMRDFASLKEKAAKVDYLEEKVRRLEQAIATGNNGYQLIDLADITDSTKTRVIEYDNVR